MRRWWRGGLAAEPTGWASWGLAIAGGAVWALQFGEHGHLMAPWLALVPLILLLGHPRAGRLGFVHGLVSWVVAIPWILPTLTTYGQIPWPLAAFCLLLLCGYLALFTALFAWLGRRLWSFAGPGADIRGSGILALAGLPALWVSLEWVRGHLFSGFPWNLAGYAWIEVPGALALSAWIGAYGLSGLVVFANASFALAWRRRRFEPALAGVGLALVALIVAGRTVDTAGFTAPAPTRSVRVIQPNIGNLTSFDRAAITANYQRLIALSRDACDRPGALLIWPESAAWPLTYEPGSPLVADVDALLAEGCPLLFNSVREAGGGSWFNSAFLAAAGEAPGAPALSRYDKRHLVPFGEYVPLAGVFSFLDRLARNAGAFAAADELALLPWAGERMGPAICFEVTFPEEVAATSRAGATILVTITNDSWYGDTAAPWQHLRAARFRAAENRKPLLRAAITGVSAVVAADGRVVSELGVGKEGVLRAIVGGNDRVTPYARRPWLIPTASALAAALAIFLAGFLPRRDAPAPGSTHDELP